MIDYQRLHTSCVFYEQYGYKRIEAPWTVSEFTAKVTAPPEAVLFQLKHNDKCLVASGEQSFLYLYLKDFLPKGQFQTITPCFRFESFDDTHSKYFLKNELIKTDKVDEDELLRMVQKCYQFFSSYIPNLDIIRTSIGYDINYKDIEIGSYGIRSCTYLDWIYGTGLAEPRFSHVKRLWDTTK